MILATSAYAVTGTPERQGRAQRSQEVQKQHKKIPTTLDDWFQALKIAPDDENAKVIAGKIVEIWAESKSDTLNLLKQRAEIAFGSNNIDVSIKVLTGIIKSYPEYFPARAKRAQLYFQKGELYEAMEDIGQVLAREPRHFQALVGLGSILEQVGEERKALAVYRRVLEIYPRIEAIPEIVRKLELKYDRAI
jgi:tetratricopeptide (TPR) repeat protein